MLLAIQRFQVTGEVGRGGMGIVYRARDPQLERDVAIKVIEGSRGAPRALSAHATINLREAPPERDDLLFEARMMARLAHPNVVPIYEVGLEHDRVFLVMEYVDGANLREWLEQPRTQAEILDVFAQATHGLAAAHAHGIVHRDFKPDNVLIGSDGRARVVDFGLSGLVVASSLVHVADGRGTPRYMAPELWRGEPATAASDVFALCRTLADALGGADDPSTDRDLPAQLREIIVAGLNEDPAKRPELAAVIAAMHPPHAARRWWLVAGGGAAVLGVVGLVAALVAKPGAPSCDDDHVLDGRWDKATSDALSRMLTQSSADPVAVGRIVKSFADRASGIQNLRRGVCEARGRGDLGEPQAAIHNSCTERRAIELDLSVRRMLAHPEWSASDVERAAQKITLEADCNELVAPPLTGDRKPVIALWRRLIDSGDVPKPQQVATLTALEHDADTAGEAELAIRAALASAVQLRLDDKLTDADKTLARAYRRATTIQSVALEALALVERSRVASILGKTRESESYAKLTLDLADKPSLPTRTRVQICATYSRVKKELGEYQAALTSIHQCLAQVANSGSMPDLEFGLRQDMIVAMVEIEGELPAASALAREGIGWARTNFGEASPEYGASLNLVAVTLAHDDHYDKSIPYRRQALAVFTATLGTDNSRTLLQRNNLAFDLLRLGELEAARAEFTAVLERGESNEAMHRYHPMVLGNLAEANFYPGHYPEAVRLMNQAIDEYTSEWGQGHAYTFGLRTTLARWDLELGRLDDAEHQVAAADDSIRRRTDVSTARLAWLHGNLAAQLARWQGKLGEAERLARTSLATVAELKMPDADRSEMLWSLGAILVAEKRWQDARAPLERSLALAEGHPHADVIAEINTQLAAVAFGLGQRAEARRLATQAQTTFAKFPGHLLAEAQLTALFSRLGRSK